MVRQKVLEHALADARKVGEEIGAPAALEARAVGGRELELDEHLLQKATRHRERERKSVAQCRRQVGGDGEFVQALGLCDQLGAHHESVVKRKVLVRVNRRVHKRHDEVAEIVAVHAPARCDNDRHVVRAERASLGAALLWRLLRRRGAAAAVAAVAARR